MAGDDAWARFERDGFLVVEDFVDADACDTLIDRANALIAGFDRTTKSVFSTTDQTRTSDEYFLSSGDKIRFFVEEDGPAVRRLREGVAINKIGHALHDLDPVFARFSHTPALAAVARDAGMREPLVLQSMYIVKGAHVGGEVTLHTDHTFLWTDPPSVTGFWFALQDATVDNGCMWALPGAHHLPARRRFRRVAGDGGTTFDELVPEPYPSEGEVPLEARKGTLIVLHGLLPHRSGPNRSDRGRAAYTLHAIEADAAYAPDNWLQRGPDLPLRGFAA